MHLKLCLQFCCIVVTTLTNCGASLIQDTPDIEAKSHLAGRGFDLISRQAAPATNVNCSDVTAPRSNACIADLDIPDYIRNWRGAYPCRDDEAFADCFLRNRGQPGLDCVGITVNSCPDVRLDPNPNDPEAAKRQYTAENIVAVNRYFFNWYQATTSAHRDTSTAIATILTALDGVADPILGETVLASLNTLIIDLQNNLSEASVSILSNATELAAFVSNGTFSEGVISVPDATTYLNLALRTNLIALALNSSDVYATVGEGTNVRELVTNGTQLAYPINCGQSTTGICDAWWVSETLGSSFALIDRKDTSKNLGPVIERLFNGTAPLSNGKLLFEDPYACLFSRAGDPSTSLISIDNTRVNLACAAPLEIQRWDMTCHNTDLPETSDECEFLERGRDPGFWDQRGGARSVPYAYLGPALTQTQTRISRG